MNRKLIFFDIDGTIIPEDTGVIPKARKRQLKSKRKRASGFY